MFDDWRARINWHDVIGWLTAALLFVLPWQTRFIFSSIALAGNETAFGILSVHATELGILIVGVMAFTIYWRELYVQFERLIWPGIIFANALFVSAFMSHWSSISWQHIAHVAVALVLFVLIGQQAAHSKRFIVAFVAGLLIPIGIGFIQVITGHFPASTVFGMAERLADRPGDAVVLIAGERVLRAYGSFSHPNIFGGYLSIAILFLVGLWEKWKTKSEKIFFFVALMCLSFGLAFTMSKSAMLGTGSALVIGMSTKALYGHNTWRKWVGVGMTTFVLAAVMGLALFPRFAGNALEGNSVSERVVQWQALPSVITQGAAGSVGWALGAGPGTYVFAWQSVDASKDWWLYQPIHHVFALVLAESGLAGLVALLWSLYVIDRRKYGALPAPLAIAGFMASTSLFAIALFDHYLWSLWQGLALSALVLGLIWASGNTKKD